MMIDVNWIYCVDHFATDTNVKSQCCLPETHIILYVNRTSFYETDALPTALMRHLAPRFKKKSNGLGQGLTKVFTMQMKIYLSDDSVHREI